tara:strand:- start:21192 stop:21569 length:378 start_codon:yes stop_codon:yes gene_type:complete
MNQYETITQIKIFKNDGVKVGGNNEWYPYQKLPGEEKAKRRDILLKADQKYYISMFDNNDGSYNVKIQVVKNDRSTKEYEPITDGISQPGMKKLGDALQTKHLSIEDDGTEEDKKDPTDDDEIPF